MRTHFGNGHPGPRAAIVIDVERIADACGYAVPYYELVDERPVLDAHHAKAPEEAYIRTRSLGMYAFDAFGADYNSQAYIDAVHRVSAKTETYSSSPRATSSARC